MAMVFTGNCTLYESTIIGPGVYCNSTTDSVACWPPTISGHVAKQPCPSIFGAPEGRYVYKQCGIDGKWTESVKWKGFGHSDYSECIEHIAGIDNVFDVNFHNPKQEVESGSNPDLNYLYITFLAISCVCLLFFVFMHCVISRKARVSSHNRILKQLIGALTFEVFITAILVSLAVFDSFNETKIQSSFVCTILIVAKEYVKSCVYFWCIIHSHFLRPEAQPRLQRTAIYTTYVLIGWGLSSVPTTIWAVTSFLIEKATMCWNDYQFMASIWILTSTRIISMIGSMWLILMSFVCNSKPSLASTTAIHVHRMRCNLLCCFWINICMVAMTSLNILEYAFKNKSKSIAWLETLCYIIPGIKGFIVTILIAVFNVDLRDYFKSRFQRPSPRDIVSIPMD